MRSREPCGCVHDGHKWLTMCDEHRAEFNDTHERWAIEHIERADERERAEADVGKVLDIAYGRKP
jgi:hypothetical protein